MQNHKYFINKNKNCAYYFYYEKNSFTFLNLHFLNSIKHSSKQYVIYADDCLLSNKFLKKHHITFKKIIRNKISLPKEFLK